MKSLLTGESVPVNKREASGEEEHSQHPGEDSPQVYSGTLVVRGSGLFEVNATGQATQMGQIGRSLATTSRPDSMLQRESRVVVSTIAVISISLSLLLAWLWWQRNGQLLQGS